MPVAIDSRIRRRIRKEICKPPYSFRYIASTYFHIERISASFRETRQQSLEPCGAHFYRALILNLSGVFPALFDEGG
ncbi:MAG: hypothetical protein KDK23_12580 [Leptospiraceae bacterium]|nr:hypothetical protein [Leptospiraceae bacterium]